MIKRLLSMPPIAGAFAFGATSMALAQASGAPYATMRPTPAFEYSVNDYHQDEFVALAEADIEKAKDQLGVLEDRASSAPTADKIGIDHRLIAVRANVKSSEKKLAELKRSTPGHRQSLEKSVTRANRRLQQSIEKVI